MISSEVQRTLVKSPPELWAELSDPAALARHLGELGEIRIVRTEPERVVEWAAENTTGTVSIKPSGWGTKVTLSVTRELADVAPEAATEALTTDQLDDPAPDEPEVSAPDASAPEGLDASVTTAIAPVAAEPLATVEPEPRRGFFARLFGRRRREATADPAAQTATVAPADPPDLKESEPTTPAALDAPTAPNAPATPAATDAFAAVRQVLEPETFAAEHPFAAAPEVKQPAPTPAATEPVPDADVQQTADIAAELLAAEEAGAEEVTAVLTAVLDRLGAAHHRPFSRS
jgi:hypothetical protein